jgi:hypothetical protein
VDLCELLVVVLGLLVLVLAAAEGVVADVLGGDLGEVVAAEVGDRQLARSPRWPS